MTTNSQPVFQNLLKSKAAFIFIIFSTILFLGEPCNEGITVVDSDPLSGKVLDQQNNPLLNVVIIAIASPIHSNKWKRLDSTRSNSDGYYFLAKGFANKYTQPTVSTGCNTSPEQERHYEGMHPFILAFTHSNYDTTVALFIPRSSFYYNPVYTPFARIDTTFVGEGEAYGKVGDVHTGPTIILKPK